MPLADETRPVPEASRERDGRPAVPAIALLLLVGLGLRLIIAYALFPGAGFESDLGSFAAWGLRVAEQGPGSFYATAGFADYTPGYLYVLGLLGAIARAVHPEDPFRFLTGEAGFGGIMRIPPLLADIAIGYVVYRLVRSWRGDAPDAPRAGLLAAALYLFNPLTWYDSALWGQVDAVGALVMLLALAALTRGHSELATGGAVLAGLIKPQFGIVMVPIVGAVLLRRHLLRRGSGPVPARPPRLLREWLVAEQGPWRLLSSLAVGLVVLFVVITPFSLGIRELIEQVAKTAGGYAWLTVNAYNPWALVGTDRPPLATAGYLAWSRDTLPLLGSVPAVVVGTVLLAAGFLLGVVQLLRRDDRWTIALVAVFLSLCFFILPTRVHERYLFPAFAFLPLLAAVEGRWRIALGVLAASSFVNFHGILTVPDYATPNIERLPLGEAFRSSPSIILSVLGHTAVFGYVLWRLESVQRLFRRGRAAAVVADVATRSGEEPRTVGPVPVAAIAYPAIRAEPPITRPAPVPAGLPAWDEAVTLMGRRLTVAPAPEPVLEAGSPGLAGSAAPGPPSATYAAPPGGIATARASALLAASGAAFTATVDTGDGRVRARVRRFLGPSVRRDRSAELSLEPGGRMDRLDLLLLVVFFLSTLTLRTWRLPEPYDMHFDEVYHARTGTEFLQHWRYGIPHSIYEFTHPHLAKYAMAGGLVAFGNDRVTATSDLGVPVVGAAIERRWSPKESPDLRNGDRVYVATGTEVRAYDLRDRGLVASIPSSAARLAVSDGSHDLYLVDAGGRVSRLSTAWFDFFREPPGVQLPTPAELTPQPVGEFGGEVDRVSVVGNGEALLGVRPDGRLVSLLTANGQRGGESAMARGGSAVAYSQNDVVIARPGEILDPAAAAATVATVLGVDPEDIRDQILAGRRIGAERIVIAAYAGDDTSEVRTAIKDLDGLEVGSGNVAAVVVRDGVAFVDPMTLRQLTHVTTPALGTGMAMVRGLDDPTLYVAAGTSVQTVRVPDNDGNHPSRDTEVTMPGPVRDVAWDEATNQVHVLGRTPDRSSETVYVIEPHGNAVYADARLPFTPAAWLLDLQRERPSDDRQELLALSPEGRVAVVDTGSHAFAWRFPGVLAGAITGLLLYLLARLLFRRRSVAVLLGLIVLLDGMFFAQTRIAMNDAYVQLFIVAAYTCFAALFLGRWRGLSAVLIGLPLVGVLLGLALAAKWVGLYAAGSIVLLVLLRSALGRVLALVGMVGATAFLGYLAWGPDQPDINRNIVFLLVMLALMVLLALAIALRPARVTLHELRFAIVAPAILGVLVVVAALALAGRLPAEGLLSGRTLVLAGVGLAAVGPVVALLARIAGRFGLGPLAPAPASGDPRALLPSDSVAPPGWLRPGWRLGLPWLWALACLTVLPIAVYVLHYAPWVALGNQWVEGVPPARGNPQTLIELTRSMYEYHNNLRATHAASSPWWAWPLDLKPVYFYQEGFANETTGLIYDSGNLVLFWLAIPAVAWSAWQAWKRRSLALALVVIALACQWLPWARIDRATFQYHVFTTLPFGFLCLAYFLAELWHGPSRRTWLFAKLAAALALLGAPLLWVLKQPLCAIAGTREVNAAGAERVCAAGIQLPSYVNLGATELLLAIVLVTVLIAAAILVLRGRDPRRLAAGVLVAAAAWLVAWYPNLSGLPMPGSRANVFQAVLPTYDYDFQFAVNMDPPYKLSLIDPWSLMLLGVCAAVVAAVIYAAHSWRLERATRRILEERRALERGTA